jgi:histidyl-tRNA synthetase
MSEPIQAIRGMNDILPGESATWQSIETYLRSIMSAYGYEEIRLPVLESTHLFKRTIGEVTDIVEKEMYTFTDLNGDSLSLRPEGTAGAVRACIEHGLLYNQIQRLWYTGPMFRHEKPQKGRYRQFHHFGVEVFGVEGTAIETELLLMCQRIWRQLGVEQALKLEINTLGTIEERAQYQQQLVRYFKDHYAELDADSQRRLERNPLRILDSKNPQMQSLIEQAPKLYDSLGATSRAAFDALCGNLDTLGLSYRINPRLVRGLDYYGHTVFEWVTDQLGSQATVCAGGRYDVLVQQLGGHATPAVGFALGLERLCLLVQAMNANLGSIKVLDVFMMADSPTALVQALQMAEQLREQGCQVLVNTAGGSFKSQFKKADKSKAVMAWILGEEEVQHQTVTIKWLRENKPQETIPQRDWPAWITDYLC